MSSLCIKTNNDEILKYLQNEFKDFNMLNVSFSSNEFKNYKNVIIHYKGTDFELFYTKLATILSYLVIEYFENSIIKTILISNYFYFFLVYSCQTVFNRKDSCRLSDLLVYSC